VKRILFLLLLCSPALTAQTDQEDIGCRQAESFEVMPESVYRKEIAWFNISGGKWEHRDSLIGLNLIEVPLVSRTSRTATHKSANVELSIVTEVFDTAKSHITYTANYVTQIDGKCFWGTDGGVPNEKIKSVTYTFQGKKYQLPKSATDGLFQPNLCDKAGSQFCHMRVFQSKDKKRLYLYMLNGDGAGGYEATIIIENGKYLRRVVDYGF
jgi:hypothetical protein